MPSIAAVCILFTTATAQENGNAPTTAVPATVQIERPTAERLTIETRDKDTQAMRGLKPDRTFRRAVPRGYGPVVEAAQREQIYKIQEEYFEVIALLELRLELLKAERDAKIEAVLTSAQLERIQRPVLGRGQRGR